MVSDDLDKIARGGPAAAPSVRVITFKQEGRMLLEKLREHRVLALVDSSSYRPGANRELVEQKVAETIADHVLELSSVQLALKDADITKDKVIALRKAAGDLRRAGCAEEAKELRLKADRQERALAPTAAEVAAMYRRAADRLSGVLSDSNVERMRDEAERLETDPSAPEPLHKLGKPLNRFLAGWFYRLDMMVMAIFEHTTSLTRHHVLTQIVPDILSAVSDFYPDMPRRGIASPLQRSKRIRGTDRDAYLRVLREFLFRGDDRFPTPLFGRQRRIRTALRPVH